jgi:hypothetical protein
VIVVPWCVGAKANVLHCVGYERGDAALLILLKRWHFFFHFSVRFLSVVLFFRVAHNLFIAVQKLRLAPKILLANQTFMVVYIFGL